MPKVCMDMDISTHFTNNKSEISYLFQYTLFALKVNLLICANTDVQKKDKYFLF